MRLLPRQGRILYDLPRRWRNAERINGECISIATLSVEYTVQKKRTYLGTRSSEELGRIENEAKAAHKLCFIIRYETHTCGSVV